MKEWSRRRVCTVWSEIINLFGMQEKKKKKRKVILLYVESQ